MAFSSDRKHFFFSDSLEYAIFRYDYNIDDGSIANREVLFNVEDGVPDGMCIDSEDNLYLMDQISDMNDVESRMDEIAIRDSIRKLGERERNILYLRFFRGKTQMEVASEIGISQAQVSRLEKNAISSMRKSCAP